MPSNFEFVTMNHLASRLAWSYFANAEPLNQLSVLLDIFASQIGFQTATSAHHQ